MSENEDDGPRMVIPDHFNKSPKTWKRADVLAFLEANKEGYDLDKKHIDVIRAYEVPGYVFLELTKQELLQHPYSLPGGSAVGIAKLIKELSEKKPVRNDVVPKDDGQRFFMNALGSYMNMTASQLGFDERYKDNYGNTFLPNNGYQPAFLYLEEGAECTCEQNFYEICKDKNCVIRLAWCGKGCVGELGYRGCWSDGPCMSYGRGLGRDRPTLEQCSLCGAGYLYSEDSTGRTSTPGKYGKNSTSAKALPIIHSEAEDIRPSSIADAPKPKPKSPSSHPELGLEPSNLSQRRKFAGGAAVEARRHRSLVVRNVGEQLGSKAQPFELVETLRDAIKCHRSLYEKTGILHCDISPCNIMSIASDLKGFLIDLDYAHQLKPDYATTNLESTCITGSAPSWHLNSYLKDHTWRHDLESFFYSSRSHRSTPQHFVRS